jgi:hypothetical protein
MNALKCLVVASALAVLPAALPAQAPAASFNTHYATFGLVNDTNYVLNYQVRWGEEGAWTSWSIAPGQTMTHYYTYAYPNQNHSPVPYVRFDIGGNTYTQAYRMDAYASPDISYQLSNKYVFRYTGRYLDLFHLEG